MALRSIVLALPLVVGCSVAIAAPMAQMNPPAGISFQQVLDIVEKAGYKNLHEIEREKNAYEVEAFDSKGKKVKFRVDAMTGAMTPMKEEMKKHHHHQKKHHHQKAN